MKYVIFLLCCVVVGYMGWQIWPKNNSFHTPLVIKKELPLSKYSYTSLRNQTYSGSPILIDKILKETDTYISYIFFFTVSGKKVSGMLTLPKKEGTYPVIIMVRGYVDLEQYTIGEGTRHGGEVFAQNNFIVLAPDFLGYGLSDMPVSDSLEDRFMSYTTIQELITSIPNLEKSFTEKNIEIHADTEKIGLWGHSNGGQIVLSVLEISGKPYPTVLWAPVSKPFPYSILYYTDEFDDHGKALRKVVSQFENQYDIERYSLTNYFDWIQAPIQIHQGSVDEPVPQKWSDNLVMSLKELNKKVTYFIYPGEDHNFSQGQWSLVMERTMFFYKDSFK